MAPLLVLLCLCSLLCSSGFRFPLRIRTGLSPEVSSLTSLTATVATATIATATSATPTPGTSTHAPIGPGIPPTPTVSFGRFRAVPGLGPPLLFLPGLDGTGEFTAQSFVNVSNAYDAWRMEVRSNDRTSFLDLAELAMSMLDSFQAAQIDAGIPQKEVVRPVLVGESFGGALAAYIASRAPDKISRLVLINPATNFDKTLWPTVGPLIAASGTLYPLVGASALLATGVEPEQFFRIGREIAARINSSDAAIAEVANMASNLAKLTDFLPAATLRWRLDQWLGVGAYLLSDKLGKITNPTLVLTGSNDRLLPSGTEGRRLQGLIKGVVEVKRFRGRGHAMMDGTLDLLHIMQSSKTFAQEEGSLEAVLPSVYDLDEVKPAVDALYRAFSPVFLCRDPTTNALVSGLGHVPTGEGGRPVLLVGNHQLLGLDLPLIIIEFLKQRGTLVRGLAHPFIFAKPEVNGGNGADAGNGNGGNGDSNSNSGSDSSNGNRKAKSGNRFARASPAMNLQSAMSLADQLVARSERGAGRRRIGLNLGGRRSSGMGQIQEQVEPTRRGLQAQEGQGQVREGVSDSQSQTASRPSPTQELFEKFGAVEVSPMNIFQLMRINATIMLFPGGIREAFHGRGEEYKLFWPEKTDFVRMAAMNDAIIVPFAAIGMADSLVTIADSAEMQLNPLLRGGAKRFAESMPQARAGVTESTTPPLVAPGLPARNYFLFGQPFDTRDLSMSDKPACREVYQQVQAQLTNDLATLLRYRKKDPYRRLPFRLLFERARKEQAPSAPLDGHYE